MNTLMKRLDVVEEAVAKKNGDYGLRLISRDDGETEEQARKRAGLGDWSGVVLCVTTLDDNL